MVFMHKIPKDIKILLTTCTINMHHLFSIQILKYENLTLKKSQTNRVTCTYFQYKDNS